MIQSNIHTALTQRRLIKQWSRSLTAHLRRIPEKQNNFQTFSLCQASSRLLKNKNKVKS
uniref:Uncharacterized protein n=1 Tax=Anguilla anguilla TaxID=7936 RepID=A0A0E9Q2H2_ANGAN